ncbi:MAG: hypothetical protein HYT80_06375, partial [Euryarchaeota archaeon]|nr:hypothetical protein [Euryarchaeota archaeon]
MSGLVVALGGAAVVAVSVGVFLVGSGGYHSLEDDGCAVAEGATYAGRDAKTVQVKVTNSGAAESVRLCVIEDDTERLDQAVELAPGGVHFLHASVSGKAVNV